MKSLIVTAAVTAALSGRMLGDVVSIDERWAGEYGGVPGKTVTVAPLESPSIDIGTEELEFAVNVVFKLR